MEQPGEICANILKIIRDGSDTGRLVRSEEILDQLKRQGTYKSEDFEERPHLEALLKQVLQENPDIKEISGPNGNAYYHSVHSLSDTYAGILAWKSEDPLKLIAEVVRKNSQLYPRPVSTESLRESPFDLTEEEIGVCLATMGVQREYQDIAQTISSIGTHFLYSTKHLDPDYAAMLAEWLDVGQADNP